VLGSGGFGARWRFGPDGWRLGARTRLRARGGRRDADDLLWLNGRFGAGTRPTDEDADAHRQQQDSHAGDYRACCAGTRRRWRARHALGGPNRGRGNSLARGRRDQRLQVAGQDAARRSPTRATLQAVALVGSQRHATGAAALGDDRRWANNWFAGQRVLLTRNVISTKKACRRARPPAAGDVIVDAAPCTKVMIW
jgi:hypothetical protein